MGSGLTYQLSEAEIDKLILKAEERGFERGQKKAYEKPLTMKEAASYLRIHVKVLSRRFNEGTMPSSLRHVVGGSILLYASELESYIRKQ